MKNIAIKITSLLAIMTNVLFCHGQMKTKPTMSLVFWSIAISFSLLQTVSGQGFNNLDFEAARNLGSPGSFAQLPASNAFPGWTVTAPYIVYNDISLSGGSITIFDTNSPTSKAPIQGKYFAYLEGPGSAPYTVSLGQTGQVPDSAMSIIFWGNDVGLNITFRSQLLNFVVTGSTANYNVYTADISAYAGQTGLLLFTETAYGNSALDNIQFSSTAIPEPSALALTALGALLLGLRRWEKWKSIVDLSQISGLPKGARVS